MIEINLLPGSGKKKKAARGGAKLDFAALAANLSGRIKDKYLVAAIASAVVAAAVLGLMFTSQRTKERVVAERIEKALEDSARFAKVVRDRNRAEAQRDTMLRQINIIRAIDGDRYLWPHVLDEVSKALPQYTWLTALGYTGTPQAQQAPVQPARGGRARGARADSARKLETEVPQEQVTVRLMGQTVDIQALTRFMRDLEASPFFSDVEILRSELGLAAGKEVTQFTVDVKYARPDSTVLRRQPLSLTVSQR